MVASLLAASMLTYCKPGALAGGLPNVSLTCEKIQQNCMARVAKWDASQAKAANPNAMAAHLTVADCAGGYAQAKKTSIWPEHLPYYFAAQCTN